jgi:hypothetical protein
MTEREHDKAVTEKALVLVLERAQAKYRLTPLELFEIVEKVRRSFFIEKVKA